VARSIEENELLLVELYSRNRLFSDKLLGSYCLVLQKLVRDGRISVADSLLDPSNKPLPVSFEAAKINKVPTNI
jgi:hypothetical protein